MSWEAPVPIFDDEDEQQLIAEFVRLSAEYGSNYSPSEICGEVFKDLRDPYPRANQAALVWGSSLAIKEQIRKAKTTKSNDGLIASKEEWELKMLALAEDETLGAQEKKVRNEIYTNIAKSRGWLDGEGGNLNGAEMMPTIVFQIDPRSEAHAA